MFAIVEVCKALTLMKTRIDLEQTQKSRLNAEEKNEAHDFDALTPIRQSMRTLRSSEECAMGNTSLEKPFYE